MGRTECECKRIMASELMKMAIAGNGVMLLMNEMGYERPTNTTHFKGDLTKGYVENNSARRSFQTEFEDSLGNKYSATFQVIKK
jgi:hypothetical protein